MYVAVQISVSVCRHAAGCFIDVQMLVAMLLTPATSGVKLKGRSQMQTPHPALLAYSMHL